jgi:hypothetical protein
MIETASVVDKAMTVAARKNDVFILASIASFDQCL